MVLTLAGGVLTQDTSGNILGILVAQVIDHHRNETYAIAGVKAAGLISESEMSVGHNCINILDGVMSWHLRDITKKARQMPGFFGYENRYLELYDYSFSWLSP